MSLPELSSDLEPIEPYIAARKRLAGFVRQRRQSLRLTVGAAARGADITTATWATLERGVHLVSDTAFAGIERILCWQPGSIDAILEDGTPTEVTPEAILSPDFGHDPLTACVLGSGLTSHEKVTVLELLAAERALFERHLLARAQEWIQLVLSRGQVPEDFFAEVRRPEL